MPKLIDKDELKKAIQENICWVMCDEPRGCSYCRVDDVWEVIYEMPTVDAEPVKHGHNTGEGVRWFRCSECGWGFNDIYMAEENVDLNAFPFYCPNCGAKMGETVKYQSSKTE